MPDATISGDAVQPGDLVAAAAVRAPGAMRELHEFRDDEPDHQQQQRGAEVVGACRS